MKLISIDVGIKNLAYCLFENKQIIRWNVVNLCGAASPCHICIEEATLQHKDKYYCRKCAKKTEYKIPPKGLYDKKVADLKIFMNENNIMFDKKHKRVELINLLETIYLIPIKKQKADSTSLVSMSIIMRDYFSQDIFRDIDVVLIENQIGPLANRMKSIQGMLTQLFVNMRIENILYVSALNKLKGIDKKLSYNERKKESIRITREAIKTTPLIDYFDNHKKKDDLADSYLQGIWYYKK